MVPSNEVVEIRRKDSDGEKMVNPAVRQSLGICDDRKRGESHMILGRICPVVGVET